MIQQDLMRRERISSQIFAEFDFALLHTRTAGVTRPTFAVCMTRDLSEYTDPYFKGIHVVFVMLVPPDDLLQINSEIMGYISSMLIEEEEFLDTVRRGEKEEIRSLLSKYLKRYFKKYLAGLS
jgi:mannitol/fructose-specific phosphotransferase system IIA component (Ntr-type)